MYFVHIEETKWENETEGMRSWIFLFHTHTLGVVTTLWIRLLWSLRAICASSVASATAHRIRLISYLISFYVSVWVFNRVGIYCRIAIQRVCSFHLQCIGSWNQTKRKYEFFYSLLPTHMNIYFAFCNETLFGQFVAKHRNLIISSLQSSRILKWNRVFPSIGLNSFSFLAFMYDFSFANQNTILFSNFELCFGFHSAFFVSKSKWIRIRTTLIEYLSVGSFSGLISIPINSMWRRWNNIKKKKNQQKKLRKKKLKKNGF